MPIHPGLISCRTLPAWPIQHPLPLSHLISHSAQLPFFLPTRSCKMEKRPHLCKPPPNSPRSYIAGSEASTAPPPSTDNINDSSPPGYCLHFNSSRNCSRTHQDTSNQARALPHTTQSSPQSHIAIFGNNHGTAAIHRQHQMLHDHQTIASTPNLAEIA